MSRRNLLPLQGIEPRFLGYPARSLVTILAQLLISQWCKLRTRQPENRGSILRTCKKLFSSSQAQWLRRPLSAGKPAVLIDSVRTSQETHYVSATKPSRLMLFRETVAVCYENHTEHTGTLRGQNAEFRCVEAGGTYSYHVALDW
jgi:hypothetical protein